MLCHGKLKPKTHKKENKNTSEKILNVNAILQFAIMLIHIAQDESRKIKTHC